MNRHHDHAPSRITQEDRERQAAAIRIHDRRRAQAAARERIARLIYCSALIALAFGLFYSIGSY